MLGFWNYTVYLTYIGLMSGFAGISLAFTGHPGWATICLLFCGFCDMFDGKIARTKKDRTVAEKQFGIQIDSLSDAICFGVLPATIGICVSGECLVISIIIGALFTVCGVVRLAYYNVTEEERQSREKGARIYFDGVPIPVSCGLVALFILLAKYIDAVRDNLGVIFTIGLFILGIAYITPVKVRKADDKANVIILIAGALAGILIILKLCKVF
ncbi:MAG: CDP-alcohol phosphatidyltransferase family protein [Lachnospiraceae bacterium]|nr:CDP-alcohol phosphatidyltransferase family protein [Lachnospiraceae bacterium]